MPLLLSDDTTEHTYKQTAHTCSFIGMQAMSMGPDIAPGSGVPLAAAPGSQAGFAMGLAVPGLTVPWGHAGYLWIATAASIAIHEVRTAMPKCTHHGYTLYTQSYLLTCPPMHMYPSLPQTQHCCRLCCLFLAQNGLVALLAHCWFCDQFACTDELCCAACRQVMP